MRFPDTGKGVVRKGEEPHTVPHNRWEGRIVAPDVPPADAPHTVAHENRFGGHREMGVAGTLSEGEFPFR